MNRPELPDVNVLLALTNPNHLHHDRALKWFGDVEAWATCPLTETGFLRLTLNPVVMGQRLEPTQALAALQALRLLPGHSFIEDDSSLGNAAIDLSGLGGHKNVTDLHLVNLVASKGLVLATLDASLPRILTSADRRRVRLV